MARLFKAVVISRTETVKYTYTGSFDTMHEAINYYEINGGRVVECKEMNVRLRNPNRATK